MRELLRERGAAGVTPAEAFDAILLPTEAVELRALQQAWPPGEKRLANARSYGSRMASMFGNTGPEREAAPSADLRRLNDLEATARTRVTDLLASGSVVAVGRLSPRSPIGPLAPAEWHRKVSWGHGSSARLGSAVWQDLRLLLAEPAAAPSREYSETAGDVVPASKGGRPKGPQNPTLVRAVLEAAAPLIAAGWHLETAFKKAHEDLASDKDRAKNLRLRSVRAGEADLELYGRWWERRAEIGVKTDR
ncbi:MAG: hypothetical protein K2X11_02545 [Acetobacteraceae bacterium]|nr:hypothetical protein [Acetobacteraceae bacterium]